MFWVIRGTDNKTEQDFAMVVEARSRAAAETWALKRSLPYIIIDEATPSDVSEARTAKRLWRQTPDSPYRVLGQPVPSGQLACLMLSGVATMALLLVRGGTVGVLF